MTPLTQLPEWQALNTHYQTQFPIRLTDLCQIPHRFAQCSARLNGILVDFSKHFFTEETQHLLISLANACHLNQAIADLFSGEKINTTENQPALHTALRNVTRSVLSVDGHNVMTDVRQILQKMTQWVDAVNNQTYRGYTNQPITDVVHIGIGGSALGPQLVTQALAHYATHLNIHFVSSPDGAQWNHVCRHLNPATTLFLIVSKSFSTLETLTNAHRAKQWFSEKTRNPDAFNAHFIGVSADMAKMTAFGIHPDRQFPLWHWVGGRYSVWSTAGLTIALSIGSERFKSFLHGATLADEHFQQTPWQHNIPVMLALLDFWYIHFFAVKSWVVLPYSSRLAQLPRYLQQLFMESNGKSITHTGERVNYPTGIVFWGEEGSSAQHSFFQLLYQGTQWIPVEFVVPVQSPHGHDRTLANALAQARHLMVGNDTLTAKAPHCHVPGNIPSTMILLSELNPSTMGTLLALYEHRTFVQSVLWNINAFDQWGVQLSREIPDYLLPALQNNSDLTELDLDDSTRHLILYARSLL
ncbi:MAG: glucose-6-phosphate isomerase [Coxiella sp. RIFCSPHIGHO2_12_FULL_44_14]|nr:MAG: glucose-6-phosphate isomerase [Coxiella sp. RIFCSPHIGHO2_12_FULL_44_14]